MTSKVLVPYDSQWQVIGKRYIDLIYCAKVADSIVYFLLILYKIHWVFKEDMNYLREEMSRRMQVFKEDMNYLREEMSRRMQIYSNEMESLREEMNQTMDRYAGHMED
jgi:hypothetical protein